MFVPQRPMIAPNASLMRARSIVINSLAHFVSGAGRKRLVCTSLQCWESLSFAELRNRDLEPGPQVEADDHSLANSFAFSFPLIPDYPGIHSRITWLYRPIRL